jgi:hypothetical protein
VGREVTFISDILKGELRPIIEVRNMNNSRHSAVTGTILGNGSSSFSLWYKV